MNGRAWTHRTVGDLREERRDAFRLRRRCQFQQTQNHEQQHVSATLRRVCKHYQNMKNTVYHQTVEAGERKRKRISPSRGKGGFLSSMALPFILTKAFNSNGEGTDSFHMAYSACLKTRGAFTWRSTLCSTPSQRRRGGCLAEKGRLARGNGDWHTDSEPAKWHKE